MARTAPSSPPSVTAPYFFSWEIPGRQGQRGRTTPLTGHPGSGNARAPVPEGKARGFREGESAAPGPRPAYKGRRARCTPAAPSLRLRLCSARPRWLRCRPRCSPCWAASSQVSRSGRQGAHPGTPPGSGLHRVGGPSRTGSSSGRHPTLFLWFASLGILEDRGRTFGVASNSPQGWARPRLAGRPEAAVREKMSPGPACPGQLPGGPGGSQKALWGARGAPRLLRCKPGRGAVATCRALRDAGGQARPLLGVHGVGICASLGGVGED